MRARSFLPSFSTSSRCPPAGGEAGPDLSPREPLPARPHRSFRQAGPPRGHRGTGNGGGADGRPELRRLSPPVLLLCGAVPPRALRADPAAVCVSVYVCLCGALPSVSAAQGALEALLTSEGTCGAPRTSFASSRVALFFSLFLKEF